MKRQRDITLDIITLDIITEDIITEDIITEDIITEHIITDTNCLSSFLFTVSDSVSVRQNPMINYSQGGGGIARGGGWGIGWNGERR